ncbi:MAG: hypothetical protein OXU64_00125 [Gemmatimonadota bacterium]|nr:hypothetical protein [Gemmatimonadota bacterium]
MPGGFCPRAVGSGRRLRAAPPERPPPSPAPRSSGIARGFVHLLLASAPHVALAAQTPDTLPPGPARGAYLDETARRLVIGAKAARDTARLGIDSYTALIRERVGVEAASVRRDRPWMHGERAIRVRWSRTEPDVAHVLGARFRHPGSAPGHSQFFPGLRTERFAADPLADPFVFGSAVFMQPRAADFLTLSPLRPDSERHYRFRSGDTISVRFGDGRAVRAVAVAVIPRYRSVRLVSAIMWIDPESFRLVRVAFRLAKKIDREMSWRWAGGGLGLTVDLGVLDSAEARPDSSLWAAPRTQGLVGGLLSGMLNNSLPRMELDISTVVAEYGLWEMRHWLPRSVRWRGHAVAAEGVTATGEAPPAAPMTIDWTLEIEDIRERGTEAAEGVPATAAEALRLWRREGDSVGGDPESADSGETVTIVPADREALTTSDLLPPPFWEDRAAADAALDEVAAELAAIGPGEGSDRGRGASPWIFHPPAKTLRLLRYNPVERLSLGTRLRRGFGWGTAELTARIGTARLEAPDIDLTLLRDHPRSRILVSFYRALRSADPGAGGSGPPGLYAAGDPADFHWSHGAAIRFLPPGGERNRLSVRFFAERDADVGADTRRDRVGTGLIWRPWWGGELGSAGGGGRVAVRGVLGDSSHVSALAEGALAVPLPDRMSVGVQAGVARVWGAPAQQDLWHVGGTGGWLRGHGGAVRAARVAMARLDLQRPVLFLRASIFGDWARAGDEDLFGVGAGLVFMDGYMRLDVAKGLGRGGEERRDAFLRLHLRWDAFF